MKGTFYVMKQSKFRIGDYVYTFPGTVVDAFLNSVGEWCYVVEAESVGLLHIFRGEQLQQKETEELKS